MAGLGVPGVYTRGLVGLADKWAMGSTCHTHRRSGGLTGGGSNLVGEVGYVLRAMRRFEWRGSRQREIARAWSASRDGGGSSSDLGKKAGR